MNDKATAILKNHSFLITKLVGVNSLTRSDCCVLKISLVLLRFVRDLLLHGEKVGELLRGGLGERGFFPQLG